MMPILILAAGASTRMRGRDKLMEVIDGAPLLRRQALMARSVSTDIRIALPPKPHARYDTVRDLDVTLIEVPDAEEGMGASLRTAFATIEQDVDCVMLLLADLPDITAQDLEHLNSARAQEPNAVIWRGATQGGHGGHPIIFDRTVFPEFAKLTGDDGGRAILAKYRDQVQLVPLANGRARQDLDTPEDWAAWHAARAAKVTSDDPQ